MLTNSESQGNSLLGCRSSPLHMVTSETKQRKIPPAVVWGLSWFVRLCKGSQINPNNHSGFRQCSCSAVQMQRNCWGGCGQGLSPSLGCGLRCQPWMGWGCATSGWECATSARECAINRCKCAISHHQMGMQVFMGVLLALLWCSSSRGSSLAGTSNVFVKSMDRLDSA